jgi:hypothetical protein
LVRHSGGARHTHPESSGVQNGCRINVRHDDKFVIPEVHGTHIRNLVALKD